MTLKEIKKSKRSQYERWEPVEEKNLNKNQRDLLVALRNLHPSYKLACIGRGPDGSVDFFFQSGKKNGKIARHYLISESGHYVLNETGIAWGGGAGGWTE